MVLSYGCDGRLTSLFWCFPARAVRVPFRIEYVAELWKGTWLGDTNYSNPEYVPPHPHYLQMVVDYVEAVLTTVEQPKGEWQPNPHQNPHQSGPNSS